MAQIGAVQQFLKPCRRVRRITYLRKFGNHFHDIRVVNSSKELDFTVRPLKGGRITRSTKVDQFEDALLPVWVSNYVDPLLSALEERSQYRHVKRAAGVA
ncbi:hypothetical protein GCM10009797_05610 [Nocardioides hwasunensis]